MKQFLKNIFTFSAVITLYFSAVYALNTFNIRNNPPLFPSTTTLAVGDSHIRRSVDPDLIEGSLNLAQQSETTWATYLKLIKICPLNKIDRVLIGLSPHTFSSFNDLKLSDPEWSSEMFSRLLPIARLPTIMNIGIEVDLSVYRQTFVKDMCLYPHPNHRTYIGSFAAQDTSIIGNVEKQLLRHYSINSEVAQISNVSSNYMDSIINFCLKSDIEPVLVKTPLHPSYTSRVPDKFIQYIDSLEDRYRSAGVRIFSSDLQFEDYEFFDENHLNLKGAVRFSKELASFIENPD